MKNILLIICLMFLATSCSYLDEKPYEYWQPEEVFVDYDKTIQLLNSMYIAMPNGYSTWGYTFLDASTDDGASSDPSNQMNKLGRGYVTEITPIEGPWWSLYVGIRRSLYFEQYIPLLQNIAGKDDEYVEFYRKIAVAESKTVRALYYFELVKRYAGVPLLKQTYTLDDKEIVTLPRNSFSECIDYIVQLCDEAAKDFSDNGYHDKLWRGYGFLSAAYCPMAIKAKALAYAASPLFSNAGDPLLGYTDNQTQTRWQVAAKALKEVIDIPTLKLYPNYEKLFTVQPNQNTEYIVYTGNIKSYMLELSLYPPSLLGNGGTCPSQNFASAFEKADGTANDMSSPDRYKGLDPRFYTTIVYDGAKLGARGVINISDPNGQDGINQTSLRSTVTGYYLRKFLNTDIDLSAQSIATTYHYFPVIRLADIYLLYAEAMNEAYGPDNAADLGMNALDALNKVRVRAGIAKFNTTSKQEMKEKIVNERRVELSFEDQRYFDLRRWKLAEKYLNEPLKGFKVEKSDNGIVKATEFPVDEQRRFDTKMYRAPIPYSEMQLNTNLIQNPGWR